MPSSPWVASASTGNTDTVDPNDGPQDNVEPGAVLHSPAPFPATAGKPVGFPWEENDHDHEPGVVAGAPVKTERLFRSKNFADSTVGEDPQSSHFAPVGGHFVPVVDTESAAGVYSGDVQGTIDRMNALSAATQSPVQPTPGDLMPAPVPAAVDDDRGFSTFVVFLIIAGITTLVGFVDMTMNRQFTWITGVAFICASIIAALKVRRRDLWTAVIAPPLAYLTALLIAGQPSTLSSAGSLLIREASLVGTGLAFNAPFIFGGTGAALIIVLIRRATKKS